MNRPHEWKIEAGLEDNATSAPKLTFFCELDGPSLETLFLNPKVIPGLRRLGASLSLGIVDFLPQRAEVVRNLNRAGIPVVAWQLLPRVQGYWYHMCNASEAIVRYREFLDWSQKQGLKWSGIGIDMEPDIAEFQLLLRHKWRLPGALYRRGCGKAKLRKAKLEYTQLIDEMHRDGFRVDSYEFPFMIDERWAKSILLQRVTGIVDIPADRRVTMLYTNYFRPYGAAVLASYISSAMAAGIGSTGGGVELEGFGSPAPLSWSELSRDLRSAARHVDDIHVFSLEGCVEQGVLKKLAEFDWKRQASDTPPWQELTLFVRLALRALLWSSVHLLPLLLGILVFCYWMFFL